MTATCNSAVFSPPYTRLFNNAKVVAVRITTIIVTPESGLLLLPTIPAIYPATAANRNPAVKIMTSDSIAGSSSPETSHTMKNMGTAIAALVTAIDLAGRSSSVRSSLPLVTVCLVASIISVIPLIRASRMITKVYNPPTSIVPTPTILLRPLI